MDLREQIARAICGNWIVGDDRPWQVWLEEADAVLEVLRQQKPVAWREFDGEGGYDYRSFADNEAFRDEYIKRNGEKYATWVEPLYAAPGAQAAVPDGWLRAIDEELVGAHIGVADASDDYAAAKENLNKLICWHVAVATDPAVNGGWQLVPIEPTSAMTAAFNTAAEALRQSHLLSGSYPASWQPIEAGYRAMLKAAPKPEER